MPSESTNICCSSFKRRIFERIISSASGERQIFPRQIIKILNFILERFTNQLVLITIYAMKNLILLCILASHSFAQDKLDTIQVLDTQNLSNSNSILDIAPSATRLHDRELKKRREPTLGDTLKNEAGISTTSFGPGASRPVIRGLEGDRIKILQNGLSILDASSQSVDHAVPVDTLVIDSIELARGPMALLYGSSALGGVVNVMTNRIHSIYEEGVVKEIQIQGDSAQNGISSGARMDYGKELWMLHLDGSYRNANNQQSPELPNTGSAQKSGAIGLSRMFSKGYLGASLYGLDNYYGVISADVAEDVAIKMNQNRLELHGEYRIDWGGLRSLKFKTAQSDYSHKELHNESGKREVGTIFQNEGNESRLEFLTQKWNMQGISGIQSQNFNFSAKGEEAFLKPTRNNQHAFFSFQKWTQGITDYSAGIRFENSHIANEEIHKQKNFNSISGSFGLGHEVMAHTKVLVNLSYTERAPNFQELYAEGPHVATQIYEKGNDSLKKEKNYSIELGLKQEQDQNSRSINLYAQHFDDFIALSKTGALIGGLAEEEYIQKRALFLGAEAQVRQRLVDQLFGVVRADIVKARNTEDNKNLPRITPPRVLIALEKVKDNLLYDFETQYHFDQNDVAPGESMTKGFFLVNAGLQKDLMISDKKLSLFFRLKNILNQEVRIHTSTLKQIAPQPGRNFVAGLQYLF